jgi:hypothetical protein
MTDITTTLKNNIANSLTASLTSYSLSPIQARAMSLSINDIALNLATTIVTQTINQGNRNLNQIPANAVGPYNPLNVVNSNLGPTNVTNVLDPVMTPGITNQASTLANKELNNLITFNAPQDVQNILGLSSIKNGLINSLLPVIDQSVNVALSNYTNSVFTKGTNVLPIVPSATNFFSSGNSSQALQQYTQTYNNAQTAQTLGQVRRFDVLNVDNKNKLETTQKGFTDPTATYPTKDYSGKPDTNKLATGEVQGTIIQKKNQDRMIGAKLPGGDSWNQPESPYKAEYPYNKVTQTESGHIIEIDDTPGAERLHVYHKSGTFIEIDANGSIVKRSVGSSYEIIDRNGKIAIAGRADISINGACNIYVGNDANIEVEGDTNITCHNDITAQAGGTLNLSATESISIRSANVYIEADNEMHILSNTTVNVESEGNLHLLSNEFYNTANISYNKVVENSYEEIGVDKHVYVDGSLYSSSTDLYEKVDGDIYIEATSAINQKSSQLTVTANPINLNPSTPAASSVLATRSQPAANANNSYAGVLDGRKYINYIELDDPQSLTLRDKYCLTAEEPGASSDEIEKTKNVAICAGVVQQEKFEDPTVNVDSESPSTSTSDFIMPNNNLKKLSVVPDNFQLSPNFTLAMMSSKAAITNAKLTAQRGLSYGEILYNMQAVALNICEPVLKLYPNMFITSGFRFASGSSATSQHPLGLAVDIQFKGASKKDYYTIARALAKVLNYDQLLLEYASTTNNPWIHISVNIKQRRNQVLTFNNHAKYSDGLTQLA